MTDTIVSERGKRLGRQALTFGIGLVAIIATSRLLNGHISTGLLGSTVLAAVVAAVYLAGSHFIEDRQPPELGLTHGLVQLLIGLGIGFGLFSIVIALLWAMDVYHPTGWGTSARLIAGIVGALMTGVVEETAFRGLLYRMVSTLLGTWGAIAVTSALFGAAHAFNPHATLVSSVAIALEAGILLGVVYVRTGSLWMPIGVHAAWNFTEANVFGMVESGGFRTAGAITGTLRGPASLTGGAFGPEASIVAVIVCLAAASIVLWQVARLSLAEPPLWSVRDARFSSVTVRMNVPP